jgi:hypothetical protein
LRSATTSAQGASILKYGAGTIGSAGDVASHLLPEHAQITLYP